MAEPSVSETRLPPSWLEVLGRVQEAVQQAEAAAAEREQAATAPGSEGIPPRDPAWFHCQQHLQECLDGLEACAGRAAQSAAQAEVVLGAEEEAIRPWLEACQTVGQKLAKGTAAAV